MINSDNETLLHELIHRVEVLTTKMPNGELSTILHKLGLLMDSQTKLAEDTQRLNNLLSNPEDGVIVRVNKNTSFRVDMMREREKREDEDIKFNELIRFKEELDMLKIRETISNLNSFKDTVVKMLWIIFTTIIAIVFKIFFPF